MERLASTRSTAEKTPVGGGETSLSEATLEPRKMQDSYAQIVLSFASKPELLEQYVNASGGIRTGTS